MQKVHFTRERAGMRRGRVRAWLATLLAAFVAFSGMSLASSAAHAAEFQPYDVTFVWKIPDGGKGPWNIFPDGKPQTLVTWAKVPAGELPNYTPAYAQECGGEYQIDSLRILSESDQKRVDTWVSTGLLLPFTDGDLGEQWEDAYRDRPELSRDNWKNDGVFSYFTFASSPESACGVTPVAPVVEQAACTVPGGTPSEPSVTLPTTANIEYTREGAVAAGETVTVTAKTKAPYKMQPATGWTIVDDLTATYTVKLTQAECPPVVEVAPVAPAVTDAVCEAPGDATDPTVTPAETKGITYEVTGEVKPGSTVTVTATAKDGFTLGSADGWTRVNDGSATYTVKLADVDCPPNVTVAPVAPAVNNAVCEVPGDVKAPTVTPATTKGITYEVTGDVKPGSTVTVTATAQDGFTLGSARGWTMNTNGSATMKISLTDATCPQVKHPRPGLAVTGAGPDAGLAFGAGALIVLGAAATILAARRKRA